MLKPIGYEAVSEAMHAAHQHLRQEALMHLLGLSLKEIHDVYMEAIQLKQAELKQHGK